MICVTGAEPTLDAVCQRIRSLPSADLHEVRLDLLEHPTTELVRRLPDHDRLVITCRASNEGGRWAGSAAEKEALLRAALDAGARYVDLEAAAPDALWDALHQEFEADRLVASWHSFTKTGPDELGVALDRLSARPAATLKLATTIDDVVNLAELRALSPTGNRPLVRIGMGLAGMLGRICYEQLGSPWTYVTAPDTAATAPGQVSLSLMRERAARNATRLLVLLGGEQVSSSPGPRVYNRLCHDQGLPYYYLAAPTAAPEQALSLLSEFGLVGASVTMPHKTAAARLASRLDPAAANLDAVNTLVRDGAAWHGYNTDGAGVLGALASQLAALGRPARAVVLGTGGAARAAAVALASRGHAVTVVARRAEAAAELAQQVGGEAAAFDELGAMDFDVLVNATPVGADARESPLEQPLEWSDRTVLDMVLRPRETRLLREVREGGGRAVPGIDMWAHQGAAQWRLLTGREVAPETLRGFVAAPDDDGGDR
ncbi:MAG: type I 3-dehydroquinate dehydratase [bacterium]